MKYALASITVPANRRAVDHDHVARLATSMRQHGQLQQIGITKALVLVFGAHRYAAAEANGWPEIEACVLEFDSDTVDQHVKESGKNHDEVIDLLIRQCEIDENFCRNELTALERAEQTAERKTIYETLHPETRHGAVGQGRGKDSANRQLESSSLLSSPSFASDTAAKTGRGESTIKRDAAIGGRIARDVRDDVRSTPIANNVEELRMLSQKRPDTQRRLVAAVKSGKHKTIREAAASLGDATPEQIEARALAAVSSLTTATTRSALARAWSKIEQLVAREQMPANARAMATSMHAARVATFDRHEGHANATPAGSPLDEARALGGCAPEEDRVEVIYQLVLRLSAAEFARLDARLEPMRSNDQAAE